MFSLKKSSNVFSTQFEKYLYTEVYTTQSWEIYENINWSADAYIPALYNLSAFSLYPLYMCTYILMQSKGVQFTRELIFFFNFQTKLSSACFNFLSHWESFLAVLAWLIFAMFSKTLYILNCSYVWYQFFVTKFFLLNKM